MACFTDDIGPMAYLLAVRPSLPARVGVLEGAVAAAADLAGVVGARLGNVFHSAPTSVKLGAVGAGYASWLLYKHGACLGVATDALLPGWRWLRALVTEVEVVVDPEVQKKRTVMESRREGSDEAVMTAPRFQARVGYFRDSKFVALGCCVRMSEGYLVGPDHVLGESVVEKFVYGRQSYLSLKNKERLHLATDLVAIKLTDREFSTIGVTESPLVSVPRGGIFAQIVGPEGKGTTGNLVNDVTSFGRVTYHGTTLGGYSGSPYTDGNRMLGIHQCGGSLNGGYSASFVWMRLKKLAKIRLESSEDWILGQYQAGRDITWSNVGDPDEVELNVDGNYTVVSRGSLVKAFGNNWENDIRGRKRAVNAFQDSVMESGEVSGLKVPGGSGITVSSQGCQEPSHQDLIAAYTKLSKQQRVLFRKSINLSEKPTMAMSGQGSAPQ